MALQTTFNTSQDAAYAGMLADNGPRDVVSRQNEESVDVPFGVLCVQGTEDEEALLYDAAGLDPLGVVFHTHAWSNATLTGDDGVPADDGMMNILRKGRVWVEVEDAVSAGGAVYARHTAGVGEQLGAFRSDSDSGDASLIPGLQYMTSAGAGELAVLDVNLPNTVSDDALQTVVLAHAALTADTNVFVMEVPAGRTFILDGAKYHNITGLAEDAANYFHIKVQIDGGAQVAADWSTETGQEGTIAADTVVDLTNGSLANRTFSGGEVIEVFYDETGTATLPAGTVQLFGRMI